MGKPVLEVIGLEKSFGSRKVLDDIRISLQDGEILALFGGSGTGKSVILRSIIGLEKPDAGKIMFQGQDLIALEENELVPVRKKIAYVFQNGALFDSMTVWDNLAYPLKEHTTLDAKGIDEEINKMLDLIGMKGSEHLLPANLSGGMQKRVGLARAIILRPEIVLYDEPTAGLDPANTQNLLDLVNKLRKKGSTGIFVTHDIPAAFQIADRIAVLYNKKIHVVDTIENIKKTDDPVVKAFIGMFNH